MYTVFLRIGDSVENIRCKSKKSVLVDVGGMNSSVGSQFISNHDFLEVSSVLSSLHILAILVVIENDIDRTSLLGRD